MLLTLMIERRKLLEPPVSGASTPTISMNRNNGSASPMLFGGTPTGFRRSSASSSKTALDEILERNEGNVLSRPLKSFIPKSYEAVEVSDRTVSSSSGASAKGKDLTLSDIFHDLLLHIPGLLIGVILNLFFSISFGQAFFPTSWIFPASVPRTIGVQMWLFATIICQVVMTWMSSFPMAVGMMMVENIPFMHVIANVAVQGQGMGVDTFSTVLVTFALSSLVVGVCFYLLGHFEMGNAVYFVPRHVIVGCIGGIGIFLLILSTEVSTDSAWAWNIHTIGPFFNPPKLPLWLTSLFFALLLRGLMTKIKSPLLAPLFFISIPPAFYAILYLTGVSVADAHAKGWFFAGLAEEANPFLMWELIDIRTVNWISVVNSLPTIVALTIFSLMHVPINIPSLSISTNQPADMNKELKAHGVSNIISGVFGGLQNYLCYSNSVTYYKCNGGGKISGMLIAALTTLFFFVGPSVVVYVPRCMAGALLFHAGIDLSKEALVDTYDGLDAFEYGSVVAITAVMTIYGMTAGLALGVLCAALTFTLQASKHVAPIRFIRTANNLRSSRWRSVFANDVLDAHAKHVTVVQLQGHIFFGNATVLAEKIEHLLDDADRDSTGIWIIVLDFTLVLGIDSSAAETIAKIVDTCVSHDVRLCYSRGSTKGFPCSAPLSDKLKSLSGQFQENAASSSSSASFYDLNLTQNQNAQGYTSIDDHGDGGNNGDGDLVDTSDGAANAERDTSTTNIPFTLPSPLKSIPKFGSTTTATATATASASKNGGDSIEERGAHPGIAFMNKSNKSGKKISPGVTSSSLKSSKKTTSTTPPGAGSSPTASSSAVGEGEARQLSELDQAVHVADNLDDALLWCEDVIIHEIAPMVDPAADPYQSPQLRCRPAHLRQLHTLCPNEPSEVVDRLLAFFDKEVLPAGTILWNQGDVSDRAVLLCKGQLLSSMVDEVGATEVVRVGNLCGEYGLISGQKRQGTLLTLEPSVLYTLRKDKYDEIIRTEPHLAFVLTKICLGYLGHRVMHVSNRIWESHCLPI